MDKVDTRGIGTGTLVMCICRATPGMLKEERKFRRDAIPTSFTLGHRRSSVSCHHIIASHCPLAYSLQQLAHSVTTREDASTTFGGSKRAWSMILNLPSRDLLTHLTKDKLPTDDI